MKGGTDPILSIHRRKNFRNQSQKSKIQEDINSNVKTNRTSKKKKKNVQFLTAKPSFDTNSSTKPDLKQISSKNNGFL